MRIVNIPANEYRRERWKNGLGWTREIHRSPPVADDWDWRVSIAEIDRDCGFSTFEGVDRVLVLLSGNGMSLDFSDGERVRLDPPHGRHAFAGERPLHCRLEQGATHDFNLMWRRGRVHAQLLHRPLVGPMVFFPDAGVTWVIHVLSGRGEFREHPGVPVLEAGDSALLEAAAGDDSRAILSGGGELLVVRLSRPGQSEQDAAKV
jgi:uncharacterized protein